MLGHNVTVKFLDDDSSLSGVLERLEDVGITVRVDHYGKPVEIVFIPMGRIKNMVSNGYRSGW